MAPVGGVSEGRPVLVNRLAGVHLDFTDRLVAAAPIPLVALLRLGPVVLASRIGAGEVLTQTCRYPGSEIELMALGTIRADALDGLKARLLLFRCLVVGHSPGEIAAAFARVPMTARCPPVFQPPESRCASAASRRGVPMTAPACARAAGWRRDLIRLATVVTVSTTAMTVSDTAVLISGTRGSSP